MLFLDWRNYKMEMIPNQKCRKCGKKYWVADGDPMTWRCIYCGNYIYFTYGAFKQQIDFIMASRQKEFVRDEERGTTAPKTSEEIRKIKFDEYSSRY